MLSVFATRLCPNKVSKGSKIGNRYNQSSLLYISKHVLSKILVCSFRFLCGGLCGFGVWLCFVVHCFVSFLVLQSF